MKQYSEKEVDYASMMNVVIGRREGLMYTEHLYKYADPEKLLNVYLFGSVISHGRGTDLDIIVEVPEDVFLEFAQECVGALDGFHPIENDLLPMCSMYWGYFSPAEARFQLALSAIGFMKPEQKLLSKIVLDGHVDMLCLPVGWNDSSSHVYSLLHEHFGIGGDPDTLTNIIRSCELIEKQ